MDKAVISKNQQLESLNMFDDNERKQMEIVLQSMVNSNRCNITSINDGFAVLIRAKELGLPFSMFADHCFTVNGKVYNDVHVAKALLSKAGVIWERTKNVTPLYKYTDGDNIYDELSMPNYCVICANKQQAQAITKDGKIGVYRLKFYRTTNDIVLNEFEISDKWEIAISKEQAAAKAKEGKFAVYRVDVPTDYCTEYKFTRYKIINGKEREITAYGQFTISEAKNADLLDNKDNWKKYAKVMLQHRAFFLGAREIADDALLGIQDVTESFNVNGKKPTEEELQQLEEI